jgi:regulator of replication initiation timing
MNIQKAEWHKDGDRLNICVPFAKVDVENRTVSGFASLDNIDRHGDIITAEASEKAFDRFRGNLREMHQPIAVGKVLSFKQQNFYDKNTGENYKGIFVTAYISKGAQDTWEKVLDKTLSGFSIGGNIIEAEDEFNKDLNKSVRKVSDYELFELSLVDNPANPLANIFSIQKGVDGPIYKGIATQVDTQNVFWCSTDEIAISTEQESHSCELCNNDMTNIGWIENVESTKSIDIKNVVDRFMNKNITKGGTDMSDELSVESAEVENNVDDVEEIATEEVADETVDVLEKSDSADETVEETVEEDVLEKSANSEVTEALQEEDFDLAKMLDELKGIVTEKIDAGIEKAADNVKGVEQVIGEMKNRINDMMKSHADMMNSHTELQSSVEKLYKRMDAYESSTAVKKSNDLDGSSEEIKLQKSLWNGHFLNVQDL